MYILENFIGSFVFRSKHQAASIPKTAAIQRLKLTIEFFPESAESQPHLITKFNRTATKISEWPPLESEVSRRELESR